MDNPYLYPGTGVLRNKLNIQDEQLWKAADADIGISGLIRLELHPLTGPFDLDRLKETHRALTSGLYEWAGKLREHGLMEKNRNDGRTVNYGHSDFVPEALAHIFGRLAKENYLQGVRQPELTGRLAFYYGELDAIHPFPDVNSRTLRKFTADLAASVGYEMSWERVSNTETKREQLFLARDQAVMAGNHQPLAQIFADGLSKIEHTRRSHPQQQQQSRLNDPGRKLPPIRRVEYAEPDRAEVQERTAAAVARDPEKYFAAYRANPASLDGRYVCSDLFKEIFPDFAASREARGRYNNPVHNAAAVLAAAQLDRLLAEDTPERTEVIFLTGVPGAGKTSAMLRDKRIDPEVRAIYEGQMADAKTAIPKLQAVLDRGLTPAIVVIHTAPEFALQNTLSRFAREGRGASIHAMATIQSQLPEGLATIRDTFGDKIKFTVLDRTAGLNATTEHRGWAQLERISQEGSYEHIRQRLTRALEEHYRAGTISEDAYRQAQGQPVVAGLRTPDQSIRDHAQQLPQRGRGVDPVERRGALRFWIERTADSLIKHAAGRLNPPGVDTVPRNVKAQRALSSGTGYDAGHLIAHRFGGPEIPANLSLQNHIMNQAGGAYYESERLWAEQLKAGNAVAVHVTEHTRPNDGAHFYRKVETVATSPRGEVTYDEQLYANFESERVREVGAKRDAVYGQVAVRLTDEQTKTILADKHPGDRHAQLADLQTALVDNVKVPILNGKAALGYDLDDRSFYAWVTQEQRTALQSRFAAEHKALTERALERQQSRSSRSQDHERD